MIPIFQRQHNFTLWVMMLYINTEMLEVSLTPEHCICPDDGYTCVVRQGSLLEWIANTTTIVKYTTHDGNKTDQAGSFLTDFTIKHDFSALYSTLLVTDLSVNGSNLTCKSGTFVMNIPMNMTEETVTLCVVGKY